MGTKRKDGRAAARRRRPQRSARAAVACCVRRLSSPSWLPCAGGAPRTPMGFESSGSSLHGSLNGLVSCLAWSPKSVRFLGDGLTIAPCAPGSSSSTSAVRRTVSRSDPKLKEGSHSLVHSHLQKEKMRVFSIHILKPRQAVYSKSAPPLPAIMDLVVTPKE